MMQQVNYRPAKFIGWTKRLPNLNKVIHRKSLDKTKRAKLLILFAVGVQLACVLAALALLAINLSLVSAIVAAILLIVTPLLSTLSLIVLVYLAYYLIAQPKEKRLIRQSKEIFQSHPAIKIGIAGSYGKTTFKEIINVVLSEKFKVVATPGNMNTPIAHARFAKKLKGDEEVLVLEYGEEYPGDTKRFIDVTKPDYAVLLGLAPNHLDYYKTLDALANDLLELRAVGSENLLINGESRLLQPYLKDTDNVFSSEVAGEWQISNVEPSVEGTSFSLSRNSDETLIKSGLIGRHFVAPLAMAAILAYRLGLSKEQVQGGLAKTKPFEHRMQPRHIGGAIVLDDTYNGNIEGILAGLDLLRELSAKRKMYVTPGLVDQGAETESVHRQIAQKIRDVAPDLVVLMKNSATEIIQKELSALNYEGEIKIENDPLNFYQNIDKVVAAGDLLMMQNDWTDNYS